MKLISIVVLLLTAAQLRAAESIAPSQPNAKPVDDKPSAYAVTKRDANSRVWERTTYEKSPTGNLVPKKHSYTELASGLHYLKNGDWMESKEEIEILPNGTARAIQGQHQVFFPGNIKDGVIELVADGGHQKSRPMGLYYYDGTNSVLIAAIKSSEGLVVGSNVVMYPDAFEGFKADLRYTYRKGSFEQDIILRQQPPSPNEFGLNPQTASLEVWTEFFDTADPVQTQNKAGSKAETAKPNPILSFGKMKMVGGKAFSLGDSAPNRTNSVPVSKSWEKVNGRKFLVEAVPMKKMATELNKLPLTASVSRPSGSSEFALNKVSTTRLLPPIRPAQVDTGKIQLAQADMPKDQSGVVLDYIELTGQTTDFTFSHGETYFINDDFCLFGDYCIIEGGAVIKYAQYRSLQIYTELTCDTSAGNTAILTAVDDDSVGETISGSTGSPSGYYGGDDMLGVFDSVATPIQYLRFYYAWICISSSTSLDVFGCEFHDSLYAIQNAGASSVWNVLFENVAGAFMWGSIDAAFITAHNVDGLLASATLTITNSLFIDVSSLGTFTGAYNRTNASDSGVFQYYTDAGYPYDMHYLSASSPYRNIGTTAVDSGLLATIRGMTTYSPQVGGYPDADPAPDLGYHYWTSSPADSDSDGMADAWEVAKFGNLSQTAAGDYDGDGISNYREYINQSNPTSFDNALLGNWPFNTNTFVGGQGQLPTLKSNVMCIPSWNTNALWVNTNIAAFLKYKDIETNGYANIIVTKGTVRFWFKPDWNSGTGPGSLGRLIELGNQTNQSGWWALVMNTNGTQLDFRTQTNSVALTNLTCSISWNSNEWHQIALTYSATNSSLYLDGQPVVTNGLGITKFPSATARAVGFRIGSDTNGVNQAKGAFEDLETFNYPLNAVGIYSNYLAAISQDKDGDGLADFWEWKYFGNLTQIGTGDYDGDGISNYREYVNQSNPTSFDNALLGNWPFNTNTFVGGQGQLPTLKSNVMCIPSWNTNALWVNTNIAAFLKYKDIETNGYANIIVTKGTVRFWFKPDWSSTNAGGVGPQSEARLIELGTKGSSNGWWGLLVGSKGTNIYFGTQTNSTATLTTNLSIAISWTSSVWHQITLIYSSTNSSLYVDGQPVVINGAGIFYYPNATERALGFRIGSDISGANQARGTFEDLETFNYPLNAVGIYSDYLAAISKDKNGDGLPDFWEWKYFGNLTQTGTGDYDGDGLSNLWEYRLALNPANYDTDGNSVLDGDEDTDGDGLSNLEELSIPVDVDIPSLGYLDPVNPMSGRSRLADGALDSDHDGLSNLGELRHYFSDPTDAYSCVEGLYDAEYFHTAWVQLSGTAPPPSSQTPMTKALQVGYSGMLQFVVSEALPGAQFDLYFVNSLPAQNWQWRRVYSGITCDENGDATIKLEMPDPYQGYFVILSAEDTDGDGLTDGYETWFGYNGQYTIVDFSDSDGDSMSDGWEVEYGLNPTVAMGTDGASGDPDGDSYSNLDEHGNYFYAYPSYDPLKTYNTSANRPVVSIFDSTANPSCAEASFTISRYVGDGGNYNNSLTVYYSVGGSLTYGTDYTLSPTPSGTPRIYSVTIPEDEQSVTVTATLIGNAVPSGVKKLVATITPYSVSPVSQVSDPLAWNYVVDWNYNRATMSFDFNNLRPTAYDQSVLACPNSDTAITLTGWDGCGDSLTYTKLSNPSHGTLTGTAPNYTYHPSLNFVGSDSFTFKVNDGLRDSATATVSITVGDQPIAYDQFVQTCRNTDLPVTLTGAGACGSLNYTKLTNPSHGTLTGTAPNYTYHPTSGYEGSDSFTFKVNNDFNDSETATIYIEVGYLPVADGQSRVTDVNRPISITLTGSDQCDDLLTYSVVSGPTLGNLSGTPPNMTYTPGSAGYDSFTFKANDGVRDSAEATVDIVVLPSGNGCIDLSATCRPRSIILDWSACPEIQGYVVEYVVYRSTVPGGPYSEIGTVGANTLTYTDGSVTLGVTYYYVVSYRYIDPGDSTTHESAPSSEVSSATCCPPSNAFWTDQGPTAQQLAEWLSKSGDTVANATFTGMAPQKGIFGGGSSAGLPIDIGVILSSGSIHLAKGPNDSISAQVIHGIEGDEQLTTLLQTYMNAGQSTHDAAVLEFDLTPSTTSLQFDYIFASEEYPEFVENLFNDAIAIFVDDVNIAWVPGTTDVPVCVYTVNSGNHTAYYQENPKQPNEVFNLRYDGLTSNQSHPVLTASKTVQVGVTVHIKIVIADERDTQLDSAIFIKPNRTMMPCE